MSDLIDRQALLRQIDIDSDGEPGYYGDTWKFIDTIKRMPSELGTNLAEVGTDLARTVKGFPIDADLLMLKTEEEYGFRERDRLYGIIRNMPKYELTSAQPERKKGKWHRRFYPQIEMMVCSECQEEFSYDAETGIRDYNYCPNCGADMRQK